MSGWVPLPPESIGDLVDVDLSGLVTGDLLQFDGIEWVPIDPNDLDLGSPGGGGTLQYSAVSRTSSFQSLTTAVETILTWQNEVNDDLGIIDLGSSTTLLTIADTGLYYVQYAVLLNAEATFSTSSGNVRLARVSVNGNPSGFDDMIAYKTEAAHSGQTTIQNGEWHFLTAGDTLQLNVLQVSGETLAVAGQRMMVVGQ